MYEISVLATYLLNTNTACNKTDATTHIGQTNHLFFAVYNSVQYVTHYDMYICFEVTSVTTDCIDARMVILQVPQPLPLPTTPPTKKIHLETSTTMMPKKHPQFVLSTVHVYMHVFLVSSS